MRFWKGEAYLEVELSDRVLVFDQKLNDGTMLHLDFETKANRSKEPNQGVFNLYNVSESHRKLIESDAKGARCYAGYDGNNKLIYDGSVAFASSPRVGSNWSTRIQCGDGFAEFTTAQTSRSYASGTETQTIVDQIVSDMGLVLKAGKDTLAGVLDGSVTLDGLSKTQLEQVLNDRDEEWSIQDGEVYITKRGEPIDQSAILLRADTGLLEHPTITDKGVNLRAQLNPDIRPGKLIKLDPLAVEATGGAAVGRTYEGFYVCQSVSFVGNNYGGPFDVVIEAVSYG